MVSVYTAITIIVLIIFLCVYFPFACLIGEVCGQPFLCFVILLLLSYPKYTFWLTDCYIMRKYFLPFCGLFFFFLFYMESYSVALAGVQ